MEFQKSYASQRERNTILKDRFASQFSIKTQPNLSSYAGNGRNSDVLRYGNDGSMTQSCTRGASSSYVDHPVGRIGSKTQTSKANECSISSQRPISQTRISEYFPDVKNLSRENSQVCGGRKRNLESFKEKYDPLLAVESNMTNEQLFEKMSNFTRISHDAGTRRPFSDARVTHENSERNGTKRKNGNELHEKNKSKKLVADDKQTALPRMVHLVGSVENVSMWSSKLKNSGIYVLYNVLATFMRTMDGTQANEKLIFVRGNRGTILECSFYEIDRPVPKITKGQLVTCFGLMIDVQRFRLFSIDILNDEKTTDIQRIVFMSERTVDEMVKRI